MMTMEKNHTHALWSVVHSCIIRCLDTYDASLRVREAYVRAYVRTYVPVRVRFLPAAPMFDVRLERSLGHAAKTMCPWRLA